MELLLGIAFGIAITILMYFAVKIFSTVRPISDEDAHALITNRNKEQVDDETNHDGASRQ